MTQEELHRLYRAGKIPARYFFQLLDPPQPIWAYQEQRVKSDKPEVEVS